MSFTVHNSAFNQDALQRVVNTAFPTEEFTLTWNIWFLSDRASSFQTYFSIGPTSFTGGNDYQVCFDGDGGVSNNFATGSGGSDTYHATVAPSTGRWYRQAYRRRKRAANDYEQFFWIDLGAGTDHISRDETNALTWASGHVLMFGSDPWTGGEEGIDGKMRCLKAWSDAKIESDIQAESAGAGILTGAGATNLWGRWPCVSDGNDVSGNARHLSTTGTVSFDGEASPDTVVAQPFPWQRQGGMGALIAQ